jgi:hypothetical protein
LGLLFCWPARAEEVIRPPDGPDAAAFARKVRAIPARNLASYSFNPHSPLADRLGPPPEFVLDYVRELDHRPGYQAYVPTPQDQARVAEALDLLPPVHRRVLQDRLAGLYFVRGFVGSGLTDYVLDEENRLYFFIVLNPDVLRKDISAWLTAKERTCFIPGSNGSSVSIDAGTRYLGLLYILLHESTHGVDYVLRITPYVDPSLVRLTGPGNLDNPFIQGIWDDYNRPREEEYPFQERITFYGLNSGPKASWSQAPGLYEKLEASPFASLYSTLSWAEDLAELATFYHLTQVLEQPYAIRLNRTGKAGYEYEPLSTPRVQARLPFLQRFYREEGVGGAKENPTGWGLGPGGE